MTVVPPTSHHGLSHTCVRSSACLRLSAVSALLAVLGHEQAWLTSSLVQVRNKKRIAANVPYNLRSSNHDGKKQRLGLTEASEAPVAESQKPFAKQHVAQELPPQKSGGERAHPVGLYWSMGI